MAVNVSEWLLSNIHGRTFSSDTHIQNDYYLCIYKDSTWLKMVFEEWFGEWGKFILYFIYIGSR